MIKYRGYSAECDSLEELLEAIKRLPKTIEYLKVQSSLQHFNPACVKLEWKKNLKDISEIIIEEALQEQEDFGYVDKFYLNSYFGEGGKKDPYYISLSSEPSREFGRKMASGHYGKLD
jgi:hypothetical protein